VLDVALREAREESGMQHFRVVPAAASNEPAIPFDLDVHRIPAHKDDPLHEHHDVRFLLVAEPGQALVMSDESIDLRWFDTAELPGVLHEESLLRMHAKATALLANRAMPRGATPGV
jgi:8-oxo-dGTP pyrophosphatase MutT (NUDIX family)